MENNEEVRKNLAKVEKELDNLEQSKLPKSFSNIKKDFDYIKGEVKKLSQKIDDLNEFEKTTSKKLLQGDNLKYEVRSINKIKKEMEKKQDSFDFDKYASKFSKRIADLEFGFESSKKEVYDLVINKAKDFNKDLKESSIQIKKELLSKIELVEKKDDECIKAIEERVYRRIECNQENISSEFDKKIDGLKKSFKELEKDIEQGISDITAPLKKLLKFCHK